ncbi:hypothetical protein Tco_1509794 [Tanacetum coccineum]
MSPIHAFSIEDMDSPEFLDSFQHIGSFQETAHEDSPVGVTTLPSKSKSKPTRGRFKTRMYPDKLHGQIRKKLHCVKVGFTAQESGVGDEDYFNRALLDYEAKNGMQFTLRHCSKRHMTYGSSSFNTESGEASINLNGYVRDDEEDKVQEVRRPMCMDKAKGLKKKGPRSSGSSSSMNDEAMARLMVSKLATHNKCAIGMKKEERLAFM